MDQEGEWCGVSIWVGDHRRKLVPPSRDEAGVLQGQILEPEMAAVGWSGEQVTVLVAVMVTEAVISWASAVCPMPHTGARFPHNKPGVGRGLLLVPCPAAREVNWFAQAHTGPRLELPAGISSESFSRPLHGAWGLVGRLSPRWDWGQGSQSPWQGLRGCLGCCLAPSPAPLSPSGKGACSFLDSQDTPQSLLQKITERFCIPTDQAMHNGKKPTNPSRTWWSHGRRSK